MLNSPHVVKCLLPKYFKQTKIYTFGDVELLNLMSNKIKVIQISDNEFWVGNNRTSFIDGDIIYVIAYGEQTDEQAALQIEINNRLTENAEGKICYLIDLNHCGKNSPGARATWLKISEDNKTGCVAIFGIHPVAKVIATFVMRLSKRENMRFFNTKEKALEWIVSMKNFNL